MTDRELRAYLLGQVSDEEVAHLEGRLLEDDDLFGTLESVEDDLFDDHARGRLEPSDRERFERRYGADGERHRFARTLSARVDRGPGVVTFRPTPAWRRWAPLAAVAMIAVVVGGVVMMRSGPPATPVPPTAPAPPPPADQAPAVLTVALSTSRAAGDPVLLTIPSNAPRVELRVRLNPADRFDSYAMELRGATNDSIVWHGTDLHAATDAGDLVVTGRAAARDLPDGAYELTVRGVRAGAAPEDLGFLPIKVVRLR